MGISDAVAKLRQHRDDPSWVGNCRSCGQRYPCAHAVLAQAAEALEADRAAMCEEIHDIADVGGLFDVLHLKFDDVVGDFREEPCIGEGCRICSGMSVIVARMSERMEDSGLLDRLEAALTAITEYAERLG